MFERAVRDRRFVQRQVLYLGEINDSQRAAWCRSIAVLDETAGARQLALFPADRAAPALDCEVVQIRVTDVQVRNPRQWGACWLALSVWDRPELDRFWGPRLPPSRQGTRWLDVLKVQVCYRLIDPGSDWRLHRHWYHHSALRDLLGTDRVLTSDTLYRCLLKLGAAKQAAGRAWALVDIGVPVPGEAVTPETFTVRLRRDRFRQARRREGRYLLRSNLTDEDPATLWQYYMQLTEIEQAFKDLKHDLAIRPVFHQREARIEAHLFVSFIAYCLHVTLKNLARPHAPGLTPRAILETFATLQMVDVHLPTTDGRQLVLPRHTRPNREHDLLLHQLNLQLPTQPAPRLTT